MSNRKTIFIRTDGTGAYTWERNFPAQILAIEVKVGDLSTPDIDITDDTYGTSFLSVNGLAADAVYFPGGNLMNDAGSALQAGTSIDSNAQAVCMGVLKVVVTGAGDTKKGRIVVLYN